jgi:hypothetical protein
VRTATSSPPASAARSWCEPLRSCRAISMLLNSIGRRSLTAGSGPATSAVSIRMVSSVCMVRQKELINRGGEKIAPLEIDNALMRHPDVAQAAAYAVPHPRLAKTLPPQSCCGQEQKSLRMNSGVPRQATRPVQEPAPHHDRRSVAQRNHRQGATQAVERERRGARPKPRLQRPACTRTCCSCGRSS